MRKLAEIEKAVIRFFRRFGVVIARQSIVNADAEKIHMDARRKYLVIGREIERVELLRYTRGRLSDAKWREFADHFNFDELDKKYPVNPLLVNPHEQQKSNLRQESFG